MLGNEYISLIWVDCVWMKISSLTNKLNLKLLMLDTEMSWSGAAWKEWLNHLVEEPEVWIWELFCLTQRLRPAEFSSFSLKNKKLLVVMLSHHFLICCSYRNWLELILVTWQITLSLHLWSFELGGWWVLQPSPELHLFSNI